MTPFIRATCGCIVIPFRPSATQGEEDCILIMACDNDHSEDPYCFSIRPMSCRQLSTKPNVVGDFARPLTDSETVSLIEQLGTRVHLGNQMKELTGLLNHCTNQVKQLSS